MNKHRMNKELSSFAARLCGRISSSVAAEATSLISIPNSELRIPGILEPPHVGCHEDFDALALELFTLQFANNAAYRKICEARGLTPKEVRHWTQIPAVPTGAFKELELACIPPDKRTAVFHSSGTTEQKPSRHFHNAESLAVYEASLWIWFAENIFRSADGSSASHEEEIRGQAVRAPLLILTPPPEFAPHSSLVHMFETVRQKLGGTSVPASHGEFFGTLAADGTWTLDFDAALTVIQRSGDSGERRNVPNARGAALCRDAATPQILLGTAFSFVHLLDYLVERDLRVELPAGSRVMETGGYKNRSRSMPKAELHALITERLGVPAENIICEYGMSELSSQAYAVTGDKCQVTRNATASCHPSPVTCHFHFPPWARVQIISPETGCEVADGETGLVRVLDLANVFSVAAIQTEDLGIRRGDGFEFIDRAHLAEPRGCSLMSYSALRNPHSAFK